MANTSYPKGMEKLLSGQINALSDTLKVALFTDAYTYSQTHEYLSQLGPLVGTDQTLTNVTVTGGVIDADDVDFGTLAPGSTVIEALATPQHRRYCFTTTRRSACPSTPMAAR